MRSIGAFAAIVALPALLGWPAAPARAEDGVVAVAWEGPEEGLRLADGRRLRLAGILVLSPGEAGALLQGALGQALRLDPPEPPLDRHGRLRAQAHGAGWLQGELVRAGLAVVDPAPDVPDDALAALLALEREARAAGRGSWAKGGLGPFPAERVGAPAGAYALVRGRARAVASAGEFVYVNFGRDWRRDFTARVASGEARRLLRQGLDLGRLAGRDVIVRGWLLEANGPMIEVAHPAQIEVVE